VLFEGIETLKVSSDNLKNERVSKEIKAKSGFDSLKKWSIQVDEIIVFVFFFFLNNI